MIKRSLSKKFPLLILCALLPCACHRLNHKQAKTTAVPEQYVIAREGRDSLKLRDEIMDAADLFCRNKELYFMPVKKDYDETSYELTFKCLSSWEPELLNNKGEGVYPNKRYHKRLGGYGELKY